MYSFGELVCLGAAVEQREQAMVERRRWQSSTGRNDQRNQRPTRTESEAVDVEAALAGLRRNGRNFPHGEAVLRARQTERHPNQFETFSTRRRREQSPLTIESTGTVGSNFLYCESSGGHDYDQGGHRFRLARDRPPEVCGCDLSDSSVRAYSPFAASGRH